MTRYRLTLEYEGTDFVGWQRQTSGPSIQAALEAAIEAFTGVATTAVAAGRTDAGVHASGQVVHAEIARPSEARVVRLALNRHLKPLPIAVLDAEPVGQDFHARFSAMRRHYRYRIMNRPSPPALERRLVWWVPVPLDLEAITAAAAQLRGHRDFTSFRAAGCQAKSPIKTLESLRIERHGEEIHLVLASRSFLHNQVRIVAGTLKWIGSGRRPPDAIPEILAARDRSAAGPTAPPQGLCLTGVEYGAPRRSPSPGEPQDR